MKKALLFLFTVLFLSASAVAGSALTNLRVERELEDDQYYQLDTAIHCYYDCGSWFSNGWSSTECETTSDLGSNFPKLMFPPLDTQRRLGMALTAAKTACGILMPALKFSIKIGNGAFKATADER